MQTNYVGKTFFIVIHEKSLRNMGIVPEWNNLPKLQADLETVFTEVGGNHYTAICISADGLYHIHDVVTFDTAKRVRSVATSLGNCHVEEMRGTKEQADDYINKRGKFEEKGEKVLAVFGNINAIQNNHGKRTDLITFDNIAIQDNFDLNAYLLDNCNNERDERYLEKRYHRLLEKNAPQWRNVKVIYVEGKAGSGKTRVATETYPNAFKADVSEKTNFPFNGYKGEKVLILDELRPGVFTHVELMQILDGYKLNLNVKYGQIPAMWETVLITTAMPLNEWYKEKTDIAGQDNRREQFKRRIAEHKIAVNNQWFDYDTYVDTTNQIDTNIPFL